MSRPRITAKVVRGLKMVRSLANADLESGGAECFPDKDPTDADRAIEYLDEFVSWYEKRGVEST
jgi:hypothetical protein